MVGLKYSSMFLIAPVLGEDMGSLGFLGAVDCPDHICMYWHYQKHRMKGLRAVVDASYPTLRTLELYRIPGRASGIRCSSSVEVHYQFE